MLKAEGETMGNLSSMSITLNGRSIQSIQRDPFSAKLFFVPFFFVHYGLFMFVHLIFLVIFFGVIPASQGVPHVFDFGGVLIGFLSLLFSHSMSYKANFIGKGEYKVVSAGQLFISPYPRIIVMHLTVILGGFFAMRAEQAVGALTIMIVMKIIVDVISHMFEHGQIAKRLI
jgi:hypothetical protein